MWCSVKSRPTPTTGTPVTTFYHNFLVLFYRFLFYKFWCIGKVEGSSGNLDPVASSCCVCPVETIGHRSNGRCSGSSNGLTIQIWLCIKFGSGRSSHRPRLDSARKSPVGRSSELSLPIEMSRICVQLARFELFRGPRRASTHGASCTWCPHDAVRAHAKQTRWVAGAWAAPSRCRFPVGHHNRHTPPNNQGHSDSPLSNRTSWMRMRCGSTVCKPNEISRLASRDQAAGNTSKCCSPDRSVILSPRQKSSRLPIRASAYPPPDKSQEFRAM